MVTVLAARPVMVLRLELAQNAAILHTPMALLHAKTAQIARLASILTVNAQLAMLVSNSTELLVRLALIILSPLEVVVLVSLALALLASPPMERVWLVKRATDSKMVSVPRVRRILILWEVMVPVCLVIPIAPLAAIPRESAWPVMLASSLMIWIAPPALLLLFQMVLEPAKTAPLAATSAMLPTALALVATLASNLTAILAQLAPLTPTAREAT
jgi:hypothetical protein